MGVVGAIGGALIQGSAAKKAAKAQERAADKDIAFQTETRDLIRNDLAPYREGGYTAQQALDYELGLGARPMIGASTPQIEEFTETTGPSFAPGGGTPADRLSALSSGQLFGGKSQTKFRVNGQVFNSREEAQAYANANRTGGTEYGGYTKTPGYDFRMQQGQSAIEASAAARGGLYSGAALRDALEYGQNFASAEHGNYLARLGARADTGMGAAQMSGAASQQAAAGVSNALGNAGNAKAAGYIGVGNALNSGINNALGAYRYQKNMQAGGFGGGR